MLSPRALEEAARAAGMWPWTANDETLWHLPSDPIGVPLGHPYMLAILALWLRNDVMATTGNDAHLQYLDACRKIEPRSVWVGAVFIGPDLSICASMVALGHWTAEYARLALRLHERDACPPQAQGS